MDDSDTDVSDNFSLHESEDSPIEDNGYSEEEKVEMGIQETYLEKTITENAEKEKAEETKKIERMNEEKIQIGSFLLVKFFNKEIGKVLYWRSNSCSRGRIHCKILKRKMTNNTFVWPIKDDVGFVLQNDIETVLPPPQFLRRGMSKFKYKFDKYNLC